MNRDKLEIRNPKNRLGAFGAGRGHNSFSIFPPDSQRSCGACALERARKGWLSVMSVVVFDSLAVCFYDAASGDMIQA